jgi:hypothetical protein
MKRISVISVLAELRQKKGNAFFNVARINTLIRNRIVVSFRALIRRIVSNAMARKKMNVWFARKAFSWKKGNVWKSASLSIIKILTCASALKRNIL